MLSKILPWDFIQKYPKTINPLDLGIYSYLINEPYLERVVLDRLPKNEMKFAYYTGNEITRDFLEEHFLNLSFFPEKEAIVVINAEVIPNTLLERLLEMEIDWSSRFLLLFFTKSNKAFVEFAKNDKIKAIELELPRFWEGAKLWQFCQKVREINLDGVVSRFALENFEHNFESFFYLIDTVKINFPDGNVDIKILQDLVPRERWDFFLLIELFHYTPKRLFEEILKKEMDYEWMRTFSAFMQTHLVKILFPEEIKKKGKLSKYDQSILDIGERFNREKIKYYMEFFSKLEILAKSSDVLLINHLRLEILKE